MRHEHHCCGGHSTQQEEYDPCMAKEVAQMERERLLYEKLKAQSDRLLLNLNIRLDKHRIRSSVVPDDSSSCSSDCEIEQLIRFISVVPSEFSRLSTQYKGVKILSLVTPCDAVGTDEDKKELQEKFAVSLKAMNSSTTTVAVSFSKRLCVCGKCEDPESKASGALRPLTMILKSSPSVIVTRNGGLLGMWNPRDGDLHSFIRKSI